MRAGGDQQIENTCLKDTNILIILQHITEQTAMLPAGFGPPTAKSTVLNSECLPHLQVGIQDTGRGSGTKWDQEVAHWLFVVFSILTKAENWLLV